MLVGVCTCPTFFLTLALLLATMSASQPHPHPDVESILYDQETLNGKCVELGAVIAKEYADLKPLLMVTVTGAYMFASDLAKCITPVPDGMQIDFIRASSYGSGTVSSGEVKIQVRKLEDGANLNPMARHPLADLRQSKAGRAPSNIYQHRDKCSQQNCEPCGP